MVPLDAKLVSCLGYALRLAKKVCGSSDVCNHLQAALHFMTLRKQQTSEESAGSPTSKFHAETLHLANRIDRRDHRLDATRDTVAFLQRSLNELRSEHSQSIQSCQEAFACLRGHMQELRVQHDDVQSSLSRVRMQHDDVQSSLSQVLQDSQGLSQSIMEQVARTLQTKHPSTCSKSRHPRSEMPVTSSELSGPAATHDIETATAAPRHGSPVGRSELGFDEGSCARANRQRRRSLRQLSLERRAAGIG